jgi:penicillin amidase
VTANNEIDRQFQHLITRDWVAPFRALRITRLLGNRSGLSLSDFEAMQADVTSLAADALLGVLAQTQGGGSESSAVLERLKSWDRRVDNRATAALYEVFEQMLWRRTFADDMPAPLFDRFYRYAANERFAGLHAIINDPVSDWFDDRATPDRRETRDDMVRAASVDAVNLLRERFGDDEVNWSWGRLHAVPFSHPLGGGGRVLQWIFSRGPIEVGGDAMTVNKTTTNLREPYQTAEGASYRQILDIGEWDQSIAVNTTGQSDHPWSRHYFDQNDLWRAGQYHPQPFTRPAVEAATVSVLELVP